MDKRTQTFTSPGTWTNPNPAVVTRVRVICIGGGGGGGVGFSSTSSNNLYMGAGGGGGYRTAVVPVSGPAPVIVGAGGTAGSITPTSPPGTYGQGTAGGSSSFNPGPTGLTADGGGGASLTPTVADAPAIGGGGGASFQAYFVFAPGAPLVGSGGEGYPGTVGGNLPNADPYYLYAGGGRFNLSSGVTGTNPASPYDNSGLIEVPYFSQPSMIGICGGGGTGANGAGINRYQEIPAPPTAMDGKANTGGGGGGWYRGTTPAVNRSAGSGGSGLVIVEWYE